MSELTRNDEDYNIGVGSEIDSAISEEVLRARVRRLIEERPPEPLWERLAKNSLVMLIVGFGLTWGVGTLLTNRWERTRIEGQKELERVHLENERRLAEERRITEARIVIINEFFGILREHNARAFLVDQALARDAPTSELADLVRAERELFARTNAKVGLILFNLRTLLAPELYRRILEAMDSGVYIPLMTVDQAHATAFEDRLLRRRTPKLTRDEEERAKKASNQVFSCSHSLAEAIWYNAIAQSGSSQDLTDNKERALKAMDCACYPEDTIGYKSRCR